MRRMLGAVLLGGAIGLGATGAALAQMPSDPEAAVEYRQDQMKVFGAMMRATAALVRNEGGTVEQVQTTSAAAAGIAPDILSWFPEGTGVGVSDSEALAVIWDDRAGFETTANNATDAIVALAAAAETGEVRAIAQALGTAGRTCGACHEVYRAE